MSGEILLRADEARGLATDVKNASSDASEQFNNLQSRLSALGDNFRGQAADAWQDRYDEWHTSATDLIEALDGLGQFLEAAANAIEDTDTELMSQLS